jgi:hypothetical protein
MDQEAERIVRAVTSANVMEAVAAFAAKRKPVFSCYIRRVDLKFNNSTIALISLITQLILSL